MRFCEEISKNGVFYLSHDKKTPTDTRTVGVELVNGPENHWKFLYASLHTGGK
jgi:hypothetical protein